MRISLRLAGTALAAVTAIAGTTALITGVGVPDASARSTTRCHFTSAEPELAEGNAGTAVKQAQCELNYAHRADLVVDGKFGPLTRSATIAFQRCVGVAQDGIIGPVTWRLLDTYAGPPALTGAGPCVP